MGDTRRDVVTRALLLSLSAASILGAALLLLGAGLPQRGDFTAFVVDGERVAPEPGEIAPPFERTTLDGEALALVDLRGSPVIVNFWATWCAPCREEMPQLQALYETYATDGLRILGVNMGESPRAVAAWRAGFGLTFDLLLDPDERLARTYALLGYPTTVVISPEGVVLRVYRGAVTAAQLEDALSAYLG
jgi:peroxiredoxin